MKQQPEQAQMQELTQELKKYMEEQFMFEFDGEVTEDTDLFKAGILDSYGYISLMAHIEQHYDVRFGEDEMLGSVMVSLSGITATVGAARSRALGNR
ncbi:acyl carrier protein [Streptomyces sp. NPDC008001]|uniref:acyl carrier protein n=1 Tax=Streptomyces sp. NPDC008001 TaxID=3364804 RepID=UPI0036F0B4A0